MRAVLLFLLATMLLPGDTLKLYLKDGGYHLVREYQVQGDRVRFYSTERDEWEEMPAALIDLAKTEHERKARNEHEQTEAHEQDAEEKAERALRRDMASIPMEAGAYYQQESKMEALPSADYQVVTDKKRRALQVLSPIPLVPGKASVVIKDERSKFILHEDRPSFYLRLAKEERFGIVSLTPKKGMRVVENISIVPVAKQAIEERKQRDTFEQQLSDGLFRVWPEKPLTPGEYALIEFSDNDDSGEIQLLVWDFAYQPGGR